MPRSDKPKVLVVGDAMLDEYLEGAVTRMSPEAPAAPVLAVSTRKAVLGGAANVAHNVAVLGGRAELVGVRGDDRAGAELVAALGKAGIADRLAVAARPTTLKTRLLDRGTQLMRVDAEETAPVPAAARKAILAAIASSDADFAIVSDYAKGVFGKEVARALLKRFGGDRVVADIKPANAALVNGFRAVTPNRHEAIAMLGGGNRADVEIARELRARLGCGVAVTLGEHGSAVCDADTPEGRAIDPYPVEEVDVTGAGDTYTAAFAIALARGKGLVEAAREANVAAALAVSKSGTVAVQAADIGRA